jgi:hypothetical protein
MAQTTNNKKKRTSYLGRGKEKKEEVDLKDRPSKCNLSFVIDIYWTSRFFSFLTR